MPKLTDKQAKTLNEYMEYINKNPEQVFRASPVVVGKINKMASYKSFVATVVMPELIKQLLKALLVLDDYEKESRGILKQGANYVVANINPEYEGKTLGTLKDWYKLRYPDNTSRVHDDLDYLNNRRNDTVHHLILKYKGDIDLADAELEPWMKSKPMGNIVSKLKTIYEYKIKEVNKLRVELMSERISDNHLPL